MLEGERNLVRLAQGGDPEAFGVLYEHYLPQIYRFILIKVSHKEQAEDLTHLTFLKAWENVRGYKHKGHPFSSWLYRIARNAVIDHYRRGVIQVSIEDVSAEALGVDDSLAEGADAKILWEDLLGAIKTLKDIEQDILIMRFVEGLPHQEIAAAVDKTEGAVKVIQHRALKKLKEVLK
ncbi:MAG: sigma-70 family RNA polymerase sigma factor [Candidatus Colwellbacteria bacterium]|nr:sigma-70 family RNA polymerase sigma factor [Candidatus Colwellbacteria bacterium]